jgi:heme a synthase
MSVSAYNPRLHLLAVITACLACLPVFMGALVTTKDAGMAFKDWPASDGHNMLTYPWFRSAGDKFLEHGHRLGGILIGLSSMALAGAAVASRAPRWVKTMAVAILISVILQGLLGGQRVRLNERGLAFVHGSLAALVMGLIVAFVAVTSRSWTVPASVRGDAGSIRGLRRLGLATSGIVYVQYVLGGLLRHHGKVLYEHLGFAFVVAAMIIWLALSAVDSGLTTLRKPAGILAIIMILQLALGAGAWVTRFGFGDRVAVYGSAEQVIFRTAHVLCGMMIFATTVVMNVRIARAAWWSAHPESSAVSGAIATEAPACQVPVAGGVR